jgi:hypothetical protein
MIGISEAFDMRQVMFLIGEFSLGDSKSVVEGVEVVAIAATPLVVVSSFITFFIGGVIFLCHQHNP